MEYSYIKELVESGFNVIPINSNKLPKKAWKDYQTVKVENIEESDHYALICGYNDVECIDIDLKVLPSKDLRDKFIKELFTFLDSNLDDFKKKICIKKTKSGGYHLIYRAKNLEGNQKIAFLEEYKEAVIETRGIGGYIMMYDNVPNINYHQIELITDEEREIIVSCCRLFNDVEQADEKIFIPAKVDKQYNDSITPWDDFNSKNSVFDIIGDEFTVIRDLPNKTVIRRIGAKSPHSGYVFKNSGCMYLFSTGTQYPAQKLISPYTAYTIKNYFGDFSKSASNLYTQGYGDRKKPTPPKRDNKIVEKIQFKEGDFPIDIFPEEIVNFLTECNKTLQNSIDYMGCALLWIGSLVIGNSLRIEVKKGWQEIATTWISIVGGAGLGKSPSIKQIISPLQKINAEERKRYITQKKLYDEYQDLTKKEKESAREIQEPKRTQFIVDDVTIEALINLHSQNDNGVGVFKDELAGWFKDMNKYKEGSDKEQWLSSWSGAGISVDRITRQSDYISKPILPVLGGIQPTILQSFFTDENKDNGFLDRILFAFPDLKVEPYIDEEMSQEQLDYYNEAIVLFYEYMRKIVVFNDFEEIQPHIATFNADAKKEWIRIFNHITELQNSDATSEFLISMLAKQKSYIPRLALIINTFHATWYSYDLKEIRKESVLYAEKLSKYFIAMYEKIVRLNIDSAETKNQMKEVRGGIYDKIKAIYDRNPDFNRSTVAKQLNVSRQTIHRTIKKIESGEK